MRIFRKKKLDNIDSTIFVNVYVIQKSSFLVLCTMLIPTCQLLATNLVVNLNQTRNKEL